MKRSQYPPAGLCEGCCYYQKRGLFTKAISRIFRHKGQWDERLCWKYCYKRLYLRRQELAKLTK
jgi:hypothetical protein